MARQKRIDPAVVVQWVASGGMPDVSVADLRDATIREKAFAAYAAKDSDKAGETAGSSSTATASAARIFRVWVLAEDGKILLARKCSNSAQLEKRDLLAEAEVHALLEDGRVVSCDPTQGERVVSYVEKYDALAEELGGEDAMRALFALLTSQDEDETEETETEEEA